MAVYMEPQYSVARIILSKSLVLWTIIDDLYDAYCTLPEAIAFTENMERYVLISSSGLIPIFFFP